ncbi:unknown [Clostridium clostridioforme CAG:132]|uniref:Uncharacterized protein n=1 Tax=[Clostridium] clostridioforme CAG:132 TaxID=1263065 RepID=R6JUL2_9FIRM|nr:unknown [[Clostridium] clostridioforme CAG:132]
MLPVVFPDLYHLVRCIVGVLRAFLHASVPRLAVEDTVSHVVIFEHIVIPALAVLILGCGQELAVIIVCEGSFRFYDLEVIDTVLVMLVDMLVAVREQVIVPALMLSVMLIIPGVCIEAFDCVLRHDEPAVIIGVIIPADNPFTLIAPVDHGYNLVPGIVGVVGIHPVGAVDFRHAVDGIIYIGGDGAGSVCHLCQVVILIVFITDTLPIRIGDALQLVTSVIGIGGDLTGAGVVGIHPVGAVDFRHTVDGIIYIGGGLTGAGGHLGNPSKPVIFITAVTASVHHGDTPAQDIIAINHTFIYGIAVPVLIGFFHQAVEDIVIIGYLVPAIAYVGGQAPPDVISHPLGPPGRVMDAGHVAFQVIGIGSGALHGIRHGGHIPHHIIGVGSGQLTRHGHTHQVIQDIIAEPGHQAIGCLHTQGIPMRIVCVCFCKPHAVRHTGDTASRVIGGHDSLLQRVLKSYLTVVLVIRVFIDVSLGVGQCGPVIVAIVAQAGSAVPWLGNG